ncbi:MAG: Ig domain protein group 2 domain protein [Gemmatimonadetes bacterium]|nr:Ig domain protein group 2 domain protein [Gemmatimonadota bacterium]
MHYSSSKVLAMLVTILAAGALACGSDASVLTDAQKAAGETAGGGSPTTTTSTVASLTVTPHTLTLPVGNYATIGVIPRDASGAPIFGRKATWRTSDASIVEVVSDTGAIKAKAIGTATVYASVDGKEDAATITVTAASVSPTTPPPPAAPVIVSAFDFSVTTRGALAGTDTSHSEIVAGTKVTLNRIKSITGEALTSAVTVATLTTDANGAATLANVPGGYYQITATPPAGSPYLATTVSLGAPTSSVVVYRLVMRRTP